MKALQQKYHPLRARLRRLTNIHMLVIVLIVAQIIIYDAGKLIPPETVLQRWIIVMLFTLCVGLVWHRSRSQNGTKDSLINLTWLLIGSDIALACALVYSQRGMASRAVALYALPLIAVTALQRKRSLLITAMVCAVSYLTTCVAYFVLHFNEGYKLELYGEAGFYALMIMLFALGLWASIKPQQ